MRLMLLLLLSKLWIRGMVISILELCHVAVLNSMLVLPPPVPVRPKYDQGGTNCCKDW